MRLVLQLLFALLGLTLALADRVHFPVKPNATPTAPIANARRLRQISRQELVARARHPEFFGKRQDPDPNPTEDDPSSSSSSSSDEAAATQPPNPDCPNAPAPTEPERRRALAMRPEKPLDPRDMAKFLLGRGEFTWDNGTTYRDDHYVRIMEKAGNHYPSWYYRAYNVVRDSVGNKLLELSVPAFKKWKRGLDHGQMIWLSEQTAIRSQDVDSVIQHLLDDPAFDDLQVHGYKISRRFFEVANSY